MIITQASWCVTSNNQSFLACNCNEKGTEEGDFTCDAVTGKCHCKCDVEGDKCDTCTSHHKGFPDCHG